MKFMGWCIVPVCLLLTACGDPLGDVERVSDGLTPLPEEAGNAALPTDAELAREGSVLTEIFAAETTADAPADPVVAVSDAEAAPARGGVLGWLRRAADAENRAEVAPEPATVPEAEETPLELASLEVEAVDPDPLPDLVEPEKRRGLFGGLRATPVRNGPDAQDVPTGTVLPFGEIARVCDAKQRDLGKLVDRAARKGQGYYLYDSAPDSAGPRTFYITGFADKCPRQFTASLAIFGSPEFHEQLRYGLPAKEYPYSTTDKAYEKVKSRICNVGRNTPCGDRITRLEKTTAFVSVYENFGANARWADMLLHDGQVLAAALKTP